MSQNTISQLTLSDTFPSWFSKFNQVVVFIANAAVSVSAGNGDISFGNGYIQGNFGVSNLYAGNLYGGNNVFSANLNIQSNVVFYNSSISSANQLNYSTRDFTTSSFIANVSANTPTPAIIDSFPVNTYRSGKYVISATDNTSNTYQASEMMILQDGNNNVYMTEYATLVTGSNSAFRVMVLSANVANGTPNTVNLWATPISNNITIKIHKTQIVI